MDAAELQGEIEALAAEPERAKGRSGKPIDAVIKALDKGKLRVCEPIGADWVTHAWIKQAILLYFARHKSGVIGSSLAIGGSWSGVLQDGLHFYDKIPTKTNYEKLGVRCVPPAVARYGSYLGRGVILLPSFVNIGAYVDEGTMVDTWATVGSCAQIGKNVHLSGGVGIGGVLEPPQAQPVIVEDGAFIGSRCIVVESVLVEREAVLGAGVVITASTPIIDVRGSRPVTIKGRVPSRAVVIPGSIPKDFPAGTFGAACALIIGTRNDSTDRKTSLESALRDYEVAV
jgi:2,3,4,5-tetrahydropyridine-2-carboxylate N-succinyltransferase